MEQIFLNSVVKLETTHIVQNPLTPHITEYEENAWSTAFFIDKKRLITCRHCIQDVTNIEITIPSNIDKTYSCNIAFICRDLDLALLEIIDYESNHF